MISVWVKIILLISLDKKINNGVKNFYLKY